MKEEVYDEKIAGYESGLITEPVDRDAFTVVIPVLNEEDAICMVINSVRAAGYHNILVVDGFSSDNTVSRALELDVKLVYQDGRGKTGAVQTAIKKVNTLYLVFLDGDCTYDPVDIDNLLHLINGHDEVIGVRTFGRVHIPILNRLGNWVINSTFNLLFSTNLHDVCSGMYALKTDFAKSLSLKTEGFDVEVEIAAQAAQNGSIAQAPISYSSRVGNNKLQPWRDGLQILYTIWRMATGYNPILLLFIPACIIMLIASALLFWVMLEWYSGIWHDGLVLLGSLLAIISMLMFTTSLLSLLIKRMESRISRKLNVKK